jgi:cysteine desulfuration protein SufE
LASIAFEDIVETFEFLEDWEDRYRHVIELGKNFADLDPALQIPATKVTGCASQVWLVPEVDGEGPKAVIRFSGTSDAMIVRGLIAILHALYSEQTAEDILRIDAKEELTRLGLDQHLSSQRSNGLRAMVARIREIAERAKNSGDVKAAE